MLVRFSDYLQGCLHDQPRSGPELNLGLLLFIPYRFLESAVLTALRERGHDLPLSEARVFQRIDREGSRMSELAEAAQLTKQTLTSIVDRLERAGYVARRPDPADARARLVTITDKGRELVDLSVPVVAAVEAAWQRHLGQDRHRAAAADPHRAARDHGPSLNRDEPGSGCVSRPGRRRGQPLDRHAYRSRRITNLRRDVRRPAGTAVRRAPS